MSCRVRPPRGLVGVGARSRATEVSSAKRVDAAGQQHPAPQRISAIPVLGLSLDALL